MKNKKPKPNLTPTEEQYLALNKAYKYFNRKLFKRKLPGCILNFSRKRNTHGFLAPERWRRVGERQYSIHEISLTPTTLYREPNEVFSTLVHEMVHLWQWEFGNPSRSGYHNREWADKMLEVGLVPSNTGKKGGKQTGQKMTHYIEKGGSYEKAFSSMSKSYILPFTSLEGDIMRLLLSSGVGAIGGNEGKWSKKSLRPRSKNKTKYSCPSCKVNVWGRPNLRIRCEDCEELFELN